MNNLVGFLILTLSTHIASSSTFFNYIGDGTNCDGTCNICSESSGCLICKPGFHMLFERGPGKIFEKGSCLPSCPENYYVSREDSMSFCLECEIPGCRTCENATHCAACEMDYELVKGRCVETPSTHSPRNNLDCELTKGLEKSLRNYCRKHAGTPSRNLRAESCVELSRSFICHITSLLRTLPDNSDN